MEIFLEKIIEKTGLNRLEAKFYYPFYKAAGMNDNIIMYGETKYLVEEILEKEPNGQTAKDTYQYFLALFREKGLIEKEDAQLHSEKYPILSGYTPFNDPELYIPYRKRGEEKWNGRLPRELLTTEGERMSGLGYEFRKI